MELQEIFDTVVRHLFEQGEQAYAYSNHHSGKYCCYRTEKGLKCAAGCLISDDVYLPEMEEKSLELLLCKWPQLENLPFLDTGEKRLLVGRLQWCHDNDDNWRSTNDMRAALREIGDMYGLNNRLVNQLRFQGK